MSARQRNIRALNTLICTCYEFSGTIRGPLRGLLVPRAPSPTFDKLREIERRHFVLDPVSQGTIIRKIFGLNSYISIITYYITISTEGVPRCPPPLPPWTVLAMPCRSCTTRCRR